MAKNTYWKDLLQRIIDKENTPAQHKLSTNTEPNKNIIKKVTATKSKNTSRRHTRAAYIFIGSSSNPTKITVREADCLLHFAKGKTICSTAKALNLSPRTVEYYLRNMKSKLKCYSKAELIEKICDNICLESIKQQIKNIEKSQRAN